MSQTLIEEISTLAIKEIKKSSSKKKTEQEWVQAAVGNISRCTIATHVSKYAHSSTTINILAKSNNLKKQGYVVTEWEKDDYDIAVSSASYMGAAKLLKCNVKNDSGDLETFITSILNRDKNLEIYLSNYGIDVEKVYDDVKCFVNDFEMTLPKKSDGRLRQVYFPIAENQYHLLTVMPSSIQLVKMNDYLKDLQKLELEDVDYKVELNDITYTKIGGAMAQNISFFNNRDSGGYYLLNSIPPTVKFRKLTYPKKDFFTESTYGIEDTELFYAYYKLRSLKISNSIIRQSTAKMVYQIIDLVFARMYVIREELLKEDYALKFDQLPAYQQKWILGVDVLDNTEKEELSDRFARWFKYRFEKVVKNSGIILDDDDKVQLSKQFQEVI